MFFILLTFIISSSLPLIFCFFHHLSSASFKLQKVSCQNLCDSSHLSHLSSTCFNLVINSGAHIYLQSGTPAGFSWALCFVFRRFGQEASWFHGHYTTPPHVLYPFVLACFDDKLDSGMWDKGGADSICGSLVGLTGVYLSFAFLLLDPLHFLLLYYGLPVGVRSLSKDLFASWCVFVPEQK